MNGQTRQRLLAIAALAVLAFNYPLLALVAGKRVLGGIPLVYGYLFATWLLVIVLTWLALRARREPPQDPADAENTGKPHAAD